MTLIQTVTVASGGSSTISFNSIPQTFNDLYLILSLRNTSTNRNFNVQFNGSGSTYASIFLNGSGSGANQGSESDIGIGNGMPNSGDSANAFSSGTYYIGNYSSAGLAKQISIDNIYETAATQAFQNLKAGSWDTAAITSLTVTSPTAMAEFSTASLYGIITGSGGATVGTP